MLKLVLMSGALGVVLMPLLVARTPNPTLAIKRALLGFFAFNVFYIFLLRVVVPRLA
jgi:hypothetical protein